MTKGSGVLEYVNSLVISIEREEEESLEALKVFSDEAINFHNYYVEQKLIGGE